MAFGVQQYNAPLECFCVWANGFTDDEIEKIVFLEKLQTFEKGKTGSSHVDPDQSIRDSEVSWLHHTPDSDWLFHRFAGIIAKVNYDHFMYNINGFDAIQYTKYGIDQHYTWHMDHSFGWQNYERKFSAVMMLTGPDEYEGGEFEICNNGNLDDIKSWKPNKGDVVFFASWMPHRVKPVISGERKSLVLWVQGPRDC